MILFFAPDSAIAEFPFFIFHSAFCIFLSVSGSFRV